MQPVLARHDQPSASRCCSAPTRPLTADHLVVLADDRGLQPAQNVVPLVRRDAVARYGPRLLAVLNTVSARRTTGSLRALNARVELRGQDPRLVAESWLRAQGLASTEEASH